jgi:heat shock protein HslJ
MPPRLSLHSNGALSEPSGTDQPLPASWAAWVVVTLIAGLLVIGACAPDAVDIGGPLAGREFVSIRAYEFGADRPLVPGTQVQVNFYDDTIGVRAGCNYIGARYVVEGGRLSTGELESTAIGCDADRLIQDDWPRALIGLGPTVRLAGAELTIESGGRGLVLVERATASDAGLVGTNWRLTTLIDGDTAMSMPDGVTAEITFDEQGKVVVHSGCNTGSGTYHLAEERSRLTFTDLAVTEMGCTGPAADIEAAVLAVIGARVVSYRLGADELTLQAGERQLRFSTP